MSPKKITLIAMMTCLIIVCSWLTIPVAIPFTLQTFAVFCTLFLLGGKSGTVSIVLYIFMGCIGLPVFSNLRGGIVHIIGPTGGYIIGFLFMALFYWLFESVFRKNHKLQIPVLAGGLLLCYLVGTIWFWVIYMTRGTSYSVALIISMCVIPYVIPDLAKLIFAYFLCKKIHISLH